MCTVMRRFSHRLDVAVHTEGRLLVWLLTAYIGFWLHHAALPKFTPDASFDRNHKFKLSGRR
jgi:hypothetical protein